MILMLLSLPPPGGNAGIGKATAVDLARRGARIILACRNPVKAATAVKEIRQKSGNPDVVFRQLDMASPDSIRGFAERILEEESRIDVLINNAGIIKIIIISYIFHRIQ